MLHSIDKIEKNAGFEGKHALLAKHGKIRLPRNDTGLTPFRPVKVKGKPVSENEATDTDLKAIEQLQQPGWKRDITLLHQREYALSQEH